MKECITHHHACDCREALFAVWQFRAERAEAAMDEKAEAARDIWKRKLDVCLEQGRQVLERAERAEALLREAYDKYAHTSLAWRAKVRELLGEGKA